MDEEQERYTRDVIDPVTGEDFTLNVYPYSWGYKYEVRDNAQGDVVQTSGLMPSLSIAMQEGLQWIETREEDLAIGGFAKDGRWIDGRADTEDFWAIDDQEFDRIKQADRDDDELER